ncbi:glycosyltransferase family 39 protein [Candidatus Woesearchaeota archaeon]|nr:glycosyltransferase family 39 protein [Candidatus Woesearchaeota archaeon]
MKIRIKTYFKLLGIFSIFLILKLTLFFKGGAYFDEGVYVGISKYFASFGKIGYFESIRPLGLPLILTPFQWLNLNPLIASRIVSLILIFISIFIVYKVTKAHFGNKSAIWSSYIFATSSLIVLFGGFILTDVISYTLALLATSLILEKKYTLSGLFVGTGFLIRFPVLIIAFPLILYLVFKEKTNSVKPIFKFCVGLIAIIFPYFLFNLLYYQGPIIYRLLTPLMDAAKIVQNETWIYPKSNLFRFFSDIAITNFLTLLFMLLAFFYFIKTHRNIIILFSLCILSILFYFSYKVNIYDIRYTLFVIPFLVVLAGAGVSKLLEGKPKKIGYVFLIIILIPGLSTTAYYAKNPAVKNDAYITQLIKNFKQDAIVTNSAFTLFYSNVKTYLMPGPNLAHTYITYIQNKNAKWLILKPDEYYCPPNDSICTIDFIKRINYFVSKNNLLYCGYFYGSRTIIMTKDNTKLISPNECLTKINFEKVQLPSKSIFIRINAVPITSDGELENENNVIKLVKEIEKRNMKAVLVIIPTESQLNKNTINFINNLNPNTELGIFYIDMVHAENFVNKINSLSEKKVTVISPKDDEWVRKAIKIPDGIKYCFRGAWDSTILTVPCKTVNLYTVKDWNNIQLFTLQELKNNYDIIRNIDYNLVIDIPSEAIYSDENYNTYLGFIDYIGKN